jgi:hypothetical protein
MVELEEILKPFFQATTTLEGQTYPTLSLVHKIFPTLIGVQTERAHMADNTISPVGKKVAASLAGHLTARWGKNPSVCASLACMLDPRTKRLEMFPSDTHGLMWKQLARSAELLHWQSAQKQQRVVTEPTVAATAAAMAVAEVTMTPTANPTVPNTPNTNTPNTPNTPNTTVSNTPNTPNTTVSNTTARRPRDLFTALSEFTLSSAEQGFCSFMFMCLFCYVFYFCYVFMCLFVMRLCLLCVC